MPGGVTDSPGYPGSGGGNWSIGVIILYIVMNFLLPFLIPVLIPLGIVGVIVYFWIVRPRLKQQAKETQNKISTEARTEDYRDTEKKKSIRLKMQSAYTLKFPETSEPDSVLDTQIISSNDTKKTESISSLSIQSTVSYALEMQSKALKIQAEAEECSEQDASFSWEWASTFHDWALKARKNASMARDYASEAGENISTVRDCASDAREEVDYYALRDNWHAADAWIQVAEAWDKTAEAWDKIANLQK